MASGTLCGIEIQVRDDDFRTLARIALRDCLADSACGTGDDRHFPIELHDEPFDSVQVVPSVPPRHRAKSNVRIPRLALQALLQSRLAIVRRMSSRPAAHSARIVPRENS
jgi:hypothetical protein